MKKTLNFLLAAGLVTALTATSGCSIVNNLRAKDKLNNGVREFNRGKYEEAIKRFEQALELAPDNANAQLFHARALNMLFEQNQTEETGMKTLDVYQQIINKNPDKPEVADQALAFQANVYDKMAAINPDKAEEYTSKRRELLLKRIEHPSATAKTKADVYYTIGHSYWDKAFNSTRAYTNPDGTLRQPLPPELAEKVKGMTQKAHEYFQRTIATKPDYADAFFYEKLTFIQDGYLTNDPAKKKELLAKQSEYQKKYNDAKKQAQSEAEGS